MPETQQKVKPSAVTRERSPPAACLQFVPTKPGSTVAFTPSAEPLSTDKLLLGTMFLIHHLAPGGIINEGRVAQLAFDEWPRDQVIDNVNTCIAAMHIIEELRSVHTDEMPASSMNAVLGYLYETGLRLPEEYQQASQKRWDIEDISTLIHALAKAHNFAPQYAINYQSGGTDVSQGFQEADAADLTEINAPLTYFHLFKANGNKLPDDAIDTKPRFTHHD